MKNVYVCNVSSEEVEPLVTPAMNFDKPTKQDKQDGGQRTEGTAGDPEIENLELPTMNFGKKE